MTAQIDSGPIWVSRAIFDQSEEHLIVPDPGTGRIYVYGLDGRILRRIANPGRGALEFEKPNLPFLIGDKFLIAASPYRWIWLNAALEPVSGWSLEWDEQLNPTLAALAPYDVAIGAKNLYAIGAVQKQDATWSDWGVFEVPLNGHTARQIAPISKDVAERSFYLNPPSNLAACGNSVYLLEMGDTVSLEQVAPTIRTVGDVPFEFRKRPVLPAFERDSLPLRKMAVRHSAAAEGVYCTDESHLLLLAHRPREGEGVQWLVYPIDVLKNHVGAPVELPTNAGEVIFVPGKKRWAVLEKGEMKRVGIQPLTRIVVFPAPSARPVAAAAAANRGAH
ncbi:MAG: hypothetical protein WB973_22045 [Thermoanaerobaculia bacterium]